MMKNVTNLNNVSGDREINKSLQDLLKKLINKQAGETKIGPNFFINFLNESLYNFAVDRVELGENKALMRLGSALRVIRDWYDFDQQSRYFEQVLLADSMLSVCQKFPQEAQRNKV